MCVCVCVGGVTVIYAERNIPSPCELSWQSSWALADEPNITGWILLRLVIFDSLPANIVVRVQHSDIPPPHSSSPPLPPPPSAPAPCAENGGGHGSLFTAKVAGADGACWACFSHTLTALFLPFPSVPVSLSGPQHTFVSPFSTLFS